jgi:cytochrome c biogenesis protein CcdA
MTFSFNLISAFFEGFFLVLSPCILSVLPIILSSTLQGRKRRAFAIVIGLLSSFILFSLFLGKAFEIFAIRAEVLRLVAGLIIAVFALLMLFSELTYKFNTLLNPIAKLGHQLTEELNHSLLSKNDLLIGLLIGACLGLIWTPCIGPFLGIAIIKAAAQTSLIANFSSILFFCLGFSLPMLFIILSGKGFLGQFSFIQVQRARQILGLIILINVFFSLSSNSSLQFANTWLQANLMQNESAKSKLINSQEESFQIGCKINI